MINDQADHRISGGQIKTLHVMHLPQSEDGNNMDPQKKASISDGSLEIIKSQVFQDTAKWVAKMTPVFLAIAAMVTWLFNMAPRSHVDAKSAVIEQKIVNMQKALTDQQEKMKQEIKQALDEKFGIVWQNMRRLEDRVDKLRDQQREYSPYKKSP